MKITENFLSETVFNQLQEYCKLNEFEIVKAREKEFSILETPNFVMDFLEIEGYDLILTFIRSAKKDFDTDARIHADNIIMGEKTALASVLYINPEGEVSENGTAFWKHHQYGEELPDTISNQEFDRLLIEDSNNLSKWQHVETVFSKPNRQLLYNSNLFHSKYPKVIEEGIRMVLVCFYSKAS